MWYVCNVNSNTHTSIYYVYTYTIFAKPWCRMRVSFWTYWQPSTFDIGLRVAQISSFADPWVPMGWAKRASLSPWCGKEKDTRHFNLDIIFGIQMYPMQPVHILLQITTVYFNHVKKCITSSQIYCLSQASMPPKSSMPSACCQAHRKLVSGGVTEFESILSQKGPLNETQRGRPIHASDRHGQAKDSIANGWSFDVLRACSDSIGKDMGCFEDIYDILHAHVHLCTQCIFVWDSDLNKDRW